MAKCMNQLWICAIVVITSCGQPDAPSVRPAVAPVLPSPAPTAIVCPGGLLCESRTPYTGWRIPTICTPERLGQRIATCWIAGVPWAQITEFYRSRYPHAQLQGPLLRVAGQVAPTPDVAQPGVPARPQPTPPLLMAHERQIGVELVFLAGD